MEFQKRKFDFEKLNLFFIAGLMLVLALTFVQTCPSFANSQSESLKGFDFANVAKTKLSSLENKSATVADSSATRITMHRLYNKYTGEHFYTADESEKTRLVTAGWTDEGTGWIAPSTSNTKVYRLYNPYVEGGDHHYTTDEKEYNTLSTQGWKQEGVGWYSVDEGESDRVPLYRQYNPFAQTGTHNYTKDEKEKNELIKLGWRDEKIGWYGYGSLTTAIDFSKINVSTTEKTYNGKAQTQTITSAVYKENTHYTVIYSDNVNAGTAKIVIAGKDAFTGSKTYYFKIAQATPTFTLPNNLSSEIGKTLNDVTLPAVNAGKFVWDDLTYEFGEEKTYTCDATFVPNDTKNYVSVSVKISVVVIDPEVAFAVYSEDNDENTLNFYKRKSRKLPTEGDRFDGKTVTKIYTNVENTGDSVPEWSSSFERTNPSPVKSVTFVDEITPNSCRGWFRYFSNLTSINLDKLDTSEVTDMYCMFEECERLKQLDVTKFDTSKVTQMGAMFSSCSALTQLDITKFDTRNVTNMGYMFQYCSALTQLDVKKFDTSKVTQMSCMFYCCRGLTQLDVTKFDTSKVTQMCCMFYGCSALTQLDVTKFDTSEVTQMYEMFRDCSSLTRLDVTKFDTSKVTDMRSMFYGCSALTRLDVTKFDTSKVIDMRYMFYNCNQLTADCSGWDIDKVTEYSSFNSGAPNVIAPVWKS